jgi:hypothetical protein
VSLLLRNILQIELAPNYVSLGHVVRRMTLRGFRSTLVANGVFNATPTEHDAAPWSGAIQVLDKSLSEHTGLEMPATVFLSNHFVRYVVVPWSDSLSEPTEVESYARHCFAKMYDEKVGQWDLRMSPDSEGKARLASAVDPDLLSALRGVLDKVKVRLHSVQPYLMAIYNDCRREFRGRDAWFALMEPGNLCLALLRKGHWSRVRCVRIGEDWGAELPSILEREAYLADAGATTDEVFVWAAGVGEVSLADSFRWHFHVLAPKPEFVRDPEIEERLAVAMEG